MMTYTDPAEMSPDQRFTELATILAAGFLRLKRRTPYLADGHVSAEVPPSEICPNTSELAGCPAPISAPCAHRLANSESARTGEET